MRIFGYLAALAATAIWAGNFVASRALAGQIPPVQFNFWRWVLAFLALLPFGLRHLSHDLDVARRNFRYFTIMAILGVTLMNTFIYQAGHTTGSLNMALLMQATPGIVILLGHFFYGQPLPMTRILGMCVATAGILVVLSRGNWARLANLHFQAGDIWALGCMICFALYSLLMTRRPANISALGFNIIVFGLGLLFALPMCIAEVSLVGAPEASWAVAVGVSYAGFGCSALAFWLWTVAIDRVGAPKSSIVYYLLPFFAAVMGFLVLGEQIAPAQMWGGAMILGGIFLATLRNCA